MSAATTAEAAAVDAGEPMIALNARRTARANASEHAMIAAWIRPLESFRPEPLRRRPPALSSAEIPATADASLTTAETSLTTAETSLTTTEPSLTTTETSLTASGSSIESSRPSAVKSLRQAAVGVRDPQPMFAIVRPDPPP
ncbi:MAG TPA: hypothetical protein VKG79_09550, partial [Bryobacteraceae bacterium]|nr:hypothetical protein [Bryobacteraceae bacterium]